MTVILFRTIWSNTCTMLSLRQLVAGLCQNGVASSYATALLAGIIQDAQRHGNMMQLVAVAESVDVCVVADIFARYGVVPDVRRLPGPRHVLAWTDHIDMELLQSFYLLVVSECTNATVYWGHSRLDDLSACMDALESRIGVTPPLRLMRVRTPTSLMFTLSAWKLLQAPRRTVVAGVSFLLSLRSLCSRLNIAVDRAGPFLEWDDSISPASLEKTMQSIMMCAPTDATLRAMRMTLFAARKCCVSCHDIISGAAVLVAAGSRQAQLNFNSTAALALFHFPELRLSDLTGIPCYLNGLTPEPAIITAFRGGAAGYKALRSYPFFVGNPLVSFPRPTPYSLVCAGGMPCATPPPGLSNLFRNRARQVRIGADIPRLFPPQWPPVAIALLYVFAKMGAHNSGWEVPTVVLSAEIQSIILVLCRDRIKA